MSEMSVQANDNNGQQARQQRGSLRSKSDVAQANEVLAKVLSHNICTVIQAIHELGLDVAFCPQSRSSAQNVIPFKAL